MAYPSLIQKILQLDINHANLARQFIEVSNRLLRMELNYISGGNCGCSEEKPVLYITEDGELAFDRTALPELFNAGAFSINDEGFLVQNTSSSIGDVSINPGGYAVSTLDCANSGGGNVEVVANLNSSSDDKALAASQGKILKEMLDASKIGVITK